MHNLHIDVVDPILVPWKPYRSKVLHVVFPRKTKYTVWFEGVWLTQHPIHHI